MDNGDPFASFSLVTSSFNLELGKARRLLDVIKQINLTYRQSAQKIPNSESRLFTLQYILVPLEAGDTDRSAVGDSRRWVARVNDLMVHRDDTRVEIEIVFARTRKTVDANSQASEKRKLNSSDEQEDDVTEHGRNVFSADGW